MSSNPTCWNDIGIWGQRTCPELSAHVHCRNCRSFALAAASFFERPAPPGYVEERARELAAAERPPLSGDESVFVSFRVGAEWFALPVHALNSATGLRPWHRLPHRGGSALLGVVNVSGDLLPCISLHTWLASDCLPPDPHRRVAGTFPALLVFGEERQRAAFPVDETSGIHRVATSQLSLPPATVSRSSDSLIAQMANLTTGPVGLLDTARLTSRVEDALR